MEWRQVLDLGGCCERVALEMAGRLLPQFLAEWNRRVWVIAIPMVLANVTTPLLGIADTAVIGHLPDPIYLGAVSVGATIFSLFFWGFGFLRMGTTGLTAQAYGASNTRQVRSVMVWAMIISVSAGVLLIAARPLFASLVFPLINPSDDVEASARIYVSIRMWGAPAVLIGHSFVGWSLGIQRTDLTLVVMAFTNIVNIFLDVVFVIGLGWGVEGVAIGTVLAEWIAVAVVIWITAKVLRKHFPGQWTKSEIFDTNILRQFFTVNLDIFLRTLALIGAMLWFTNRSAQLGDIVLAANAVLLNFTMFTAFFLDGIAFAAEALVGEAKGARDSGAFQKAVIVSAGWSLFFAVVGALVYLVAGAVIIAALTDIHGVRTEANRYLPWVVALPLLAVWPFLLDGIFIGATRTVAMRNGMWAAFAGFIALTVVFVPLWQNHGLWLAFTLFMVLRALTLAVRFPALARSITGVKHTSKVSSG